MKNKKTYLSLRLKIWFWFLLVFIPAYSAMGYWYYRFIVRHELEFLTTDLSHQLNGISSTMDTENLKALYESETATNENCPPKAGISFDDPENGYFPEDNPLFLKHMQWIKTIIAVEPDRSIYTYVKAPEKGYVVLIGSSWYFTNRDESFKFCQLYKAPDMYQALSSRMDRWEPYNDEFGYWISTYMPIKDENGEVVGGVGVDVPASQIVEIRDDLLRGATLLLLGVIVVSFAIAYSLTVTISEPLSKLTSITGSVQESVSVIDPSVFNLKRGWWRDEIDGLSKSVQDMMIRLNKQTGELSQSRTDMQELAQGVIRAQESERKYISRELHGEAGQLLVMLKATLEDFLFDLPGDEEETNPDIFKHSTFRGRLTSAIKQIENTLGVVRSISHQMRPSLLDVGDVNLALRGYCKEFSQRQKIEVVYEGYIVPNPPEEIAVSFYRFLQEALTNVSKHSSATRILVRAQMDGDWIQLSVEDNGREDKPVSSSKGIGIAGLKERFFLMGGTVEAGPVSGGFLIVARAPLTRK